MSDGFTLQTKGLDALKRRLAGMPKALDKAVDAGLFVAGRKIERDAKESLRHRGSGAVYKHGKVTHQASSPGQPPATDTGRLGNSINVVQLLDKGVVEVRAGGSRSNVKYAAMLEYGTVHMEPRPFMRPALLRNKKFITQAVSAKIAEALKDGAR